MTMGKGKSRQQMFAAKKAAKESKMSRPGAKSNYAKKRSFLRRAGGFGFDYPTPKPWK